MHFYWTFPDCEQPVRVLDIKLSRVFPGQIRMLPESGPGATGKLAIAGAGRE